MKRTTLPKLVLDRQTIRALDLVQLKPVAGGAPTTSNRLSCTGCDGDK